jgi:hypothetical protein
MDVRGFVQNRLTLNEAAYWGSRLKDHLLGTGKPQAWLPGHRCVLSRVYWRSYNGLTGGEILPVRCHWHGGKDWCGSSLGLDLLRLTGVDRQHKSREAQSLYPSALQLARALRLRFVGHATWPISSQECVWCASASFLYKQTHVNISPSRDSWGCGTFRGASWPTGRRPVLLRAMRRVRAI